MHEVRTRLSLHRQDTKAKEYASAAALHAVEVESGTRSNKFLRTGSASSLRISNWFSRYTVPRRPKDGTALRMRWSNRRMVRQGLFRVGRTHGAEMVRAGIDPHAAPSTHAQRDEDETRRSSTKLSTRRATTTNSSRPSSRKPGNGYVVCPHWMNRR